MNRESFQICIFWEQGENKSKSWNLTIEKDAIMRKKSTHPNSDREAHGSLLKRLQALKEAELQNNILIPLFLAVGYDVVEPHGV